MAPIWRPKFLLSLLVVLSTIPTLFAEPNPVLQRPSQAHLAAPDAFGTDKVQTKGRRVAIIGAGAAGSSTAYHLQQLSLSSSDGLNTSITIFDSNPRVGGRSRTVDILDDPRYPAELGASIFSQKYNRILVEAARKFNLSTCDTEATRPSNGATNGFGVWDGEQFVFKSGSNDDQGDKWNWIWDMVRLLWQYGLAPLKIRRLTQDTVAKFLQMYDGPFFPFASLTKVASDTGLLGVTSQTGMEFLSRNGVRDDFAREIVQASTRVNYGQNLGLIHGLETMVCMATEGAVAVEGGNWKIFDSMVKESGADMRLNTRVTEVQRLLEGGYTIKSRKAIEGTMIESSQREEENFDVVVLAAPFQFSDIDFKPSLPVSHEPKSIPYVSLHVTLLTSPHRPSPKFFNHLQDPSQPDSDQESIPWTILTTLPPTADLGPDEGDLPYSMHGVGPTGFWSISTLRTVQVRDLDGKEQEQYLYKIFTPGPLNETFVADLFDISPSSTPYSDTLIAYNEQQEQLLSSTSDFAFPRQHISSLYTKKWNYAYPYAFPRPTQAHKPSSHSSSSYLSDEDRYRNTSNKSQHDQFSFPPIYLDGSSLYYTSGIETLISTMETSALMGKNIAALIVRDLGNGPEGRASSSRFEY